jgi:hypothetical protein
MNSKKCDSLVSTIEEPLKRKSRGFGLENREYGRGDPSRWPRDTFIRKSWHKLRRQAAVGIFGSRTKATCYSYYSMECVGKRQCEIYLKGFRKTGLQSEIWTRNPTSEARAPGHTHDHNIQQHKTARSWFSRKPAKSAYRQWRGGPVAMITNQYSIRTSSLLFRPTRGRCSRMSQHFCSRLLEARARVEGKRLHNQPRK